VTDIYPPEYDGPLHDGPECDCELDECDCDDNWLPDHVDREEVYNRGPRW